MGRHVPTQRNCRTTSKRRSTERYRLTPPSPPPRDRPKQLPLTDKSLAWRGEGGGHRITEFLDGLWERRGAFLAKVRGACRASDIFKKYAGKE